MFNAQILSWIYLFFFFFSPYLRILTLGNLFSGLRPLKLFLTCSTYFWNDIHIFALFSLFLEPRIIPLDTTFGPFLGGLGGSTMKGCWGFPRWRQEAQDSASHMVCVCVYQSLEDWFLWAFFYFLSWSYLVCLSIMAFQKANGVAKTMKLKLM